MNWLKQALSRGKMYDDLAEEMQLHLEQKIEAFIESGISRKEAESQAKREFGNTTVITERSREIWQWPIAESIYADSKYALRQLRRSPGFAFTAILALALGIAATATIFGFVDSALIKPLPYRNASRLVEVFASTRQSQRTLSSYPNYLDLERSNHLLASTAAYDVRRTYVLTDASGAQQVNGIGVTGRFFRTLGIAPVLGRDFDANTANEDLRTASPTVILSYTAWQQRFGGRSDAIGKTVTLNGGPYTVIGVLPRSFQFAPTGAVEFWTTLHAYANDPCELQRTCSVMGIVARLGVGVTLHQALANAQAIAAQDAKQYPNADHGLGANIVPLSQVILGDVKPILLALFGGSGCS